MNAMVSYGGSMSWADSPVRGVRRKRLFHSGPAESGVVTSVVEFAPGSVFPDHGHPEGEEILVLDGTFSDQQGDFTRGSYLLNPEGFRHAPYTREGCTLFVKLRQYAGREREHVCLDTTHGAWASQAPLGRGQVRRLPLYHSERYPERIQLIELAPGAELPPVTLPEGEELFVISGEISLQIADEQRVYPAHSWLRLPPGSVHGRKSAKGALLYARTGGF